MQRALYQFIFYHIFVGLLTVNLCIGVIMVNASCVVVARSIAVKELIFHTMWATPRKLKLNVCED